MRLELEAWLSLAAANFVKPLRVHQLGVQNRRAGGAANRIVSQRDELGVHHRALAQAADGDRHAAAEVRIEPRLRPVRFLHHDDRRLRRARQPQLLRLAAKLAHRLGDRVDRGLLLERHRHRDRVAVDHRHAIGVRADDRGYGARPPSLPRIFSVSRLHLLFFAADERHDVAENVERRHAGISRARHRLHRRDDHGADVERAQRRQRHREHDGRTIRIGDDGAGPALRAPLLADQLQVIGIDLRNQQRHERIHAEVARVADDDVAGRGEGAFDIAGDRRIEAGEHDLRSLAGHARVDDAVAAPSGIGVVSFHGATLIGLAFRALARREPRAPEPRMRARRETNCCPTIPVAPNTPTSIAPRPSPSPEQQKTRLGICRGGCLLTLVGPVDGSVAYKVTSDPRSRRATRPLSGGALSHLGLGHWARV